MAAAWREREAARRQAEANAALANPAPTLNSNYAIKGTPMPGAAPPPPPVAPGAAPLAPAASAGPTAPVNQSYSMNGHRMPVSKQPDDVTQSPGGRY
jgi:hypothetical protein